jgi:hypothetical protein
MEDTILAAALVLFFATQIFTVILVIYAWRRGMPSINRELKRQEDARIREMAKLPELPPHLQLSNHRFWMLAVASLGVWPFALIAWSLANLIGIAAVVILTVLVAIALNNESARLRAKIEKVHSELHDHNSELKDRT